MYTLVLSPGFCDKRKDFTQATFHVEGARRRIAFIIIGCSAKAVSSETSHPCWHTTWRSQRRCCRTLSILGNTRHQFWQLHSVAVRISWFPSLTFSWCSQALVPLPSRFRYYRTRSDGCLSRSVSATWSVLFLVHVVSSLSQRTAFSRRASSNKSRSVSAGACLDITLQSQRRSLTFSAKHDRS
jgi:hypothetical protein